MVSPFSGALGLLRPVFVGFCTLVACGAFGQFTPTENRLLGDALAVGGLSAEDLNFARKSFEPRFGLPLVSKALEKPLNGLADSMEFQSAPSSDAAKLLRVVVEKIFAEPIKPPSETSPQPIKSLGVVPLELREPVQSLFEAVRQSQVDVRTALSKLTPVEKRLAIESLAQWAVAGTDITVDFAKQKRMTRETLYGALGKVDLKLIRASAFRVAEAIEEALPKLRLAAANGWAGKVVFSEYGVNVEITGVGDDLHASGSSNLCIDLGGRNRYTNRYGAGIGYTGVLIDLGNEIKSEFPDASAGAGILGIGIAHFDGFKTDLNSKNLSFGAGLGGVGILTTEQSVRIESRAAGQGFGMCGIGLCIGSKGSDTYKLGYLGQGAGMMGGMGWLVNSGGNDRYRAGGVTTETSVTGAYVCRAQGFSGLMPGGIGMLTDLAGDDLYESGTETQACAIGYGLASLSDLKGHDTYVAGFRAQGCAMFEGVAQFLEHEGDDGYLVRRGECHAYAADRSVSILIDRAGDDIVAARNSQPASSDEGSVSIYLDAGGSDSFSGPTGVLSTRNGRTGISVFADSGGDNQFVVGPPNGTAWAKGGPGISFGGDQGVSITEPEPLKPGSVTATQTEIEALWEEVQIGGKDAVKAGRKLTEIGMPALEYFAKNVVHQSSPRSRRIVVLMLSAIQGAKDFMVFQAPLASAFGKAAWLDIAAQAKISELKGILGPALTNDITRRYACRYAAAIGSTEYLDQIAGLILAGDPLTSQDAAIAYCALASDKEVSTVESLIRTPDLIVRTECLKFVARYPRGLALGRQLLSTNDEVSQSLGVELLGYVGTDEAVRLAGAGLNSNYSSVKIKALNTISGRVPEAYRQRVVELTNDSNSLVAMVARGVDLGK